MSVEGHMLVSTLTLQATADILSKGVSCEVTNEHGSDKKSVPVSLKRGEFLLNLCDQLPSRWP